MRSVCICMYYLGENNIYINIYIFIIAIIENN
uniref:Uncharacterized protein n=1 Tax=Anguilla anguilla TaxID=7936 RepID=A0A0E9R2F9_ANGAN